MAKNKNMTKDERFKARLLDRAEKVKGQRVGMAATFTKLTRKTGPMGTSKAKAGKNACRQKGRTPKGGW